MRLVAVVPDPAFAQDRLFAPERPDGSRGSFRHLRERLAQRGCRVHTADVLEATGEIPDLVIWVNLPPAPPAQLVPSSWRAAPQWALLCEPVVVAPGNYEPVRQAWFDRLFTWLPSLVDGVRFFQLELPNILDPDDWPLPAPERLFTLVAGNKSSRHPLELYSARRAVIRWFERHHPNDFDLYGIGWDRPSPGAPRPLRAVGRIAPRLVTRYPSYRGSIPEKRGVLRRYRFTICFENAREIEGYVTEKLFDCLLAGSIPVYWGAPDIERHVPPACFVDYRRFGSNDELYDRLTALPDDEWEAMRRAGQEFLRSDAAARYGVRAWADTLIAHIVG